MQKYWYIVWLLMAGFLLAPLHRSYACGHAASCCKKTGTVSASLKLLGQPAVTAPQVPATQSVYTGKNVHTVRTRHACGCSGKCTHSGCHCSASCNTTVSVLPPYFTYIPVTALSQPMRWYYQVTLPPSVYLSCKIPPKIG
ncbi:hypothetical protein HNQ91_000196 [Filimonas zeae]|uniref:hypothetical protein n=1 Tax=Filimonas zeae TaxID=1737353 RepID=UPI00166B0A02|nr:hypothetical protein [Filimonas zeae]MDR6337174.1 hypothetical protein [Filimonas zeae]